MQAASEATGLAKVAQPKSATAGLRSPSGTRAPESRTGISLFQVTDAKSQVKVGNILQKSTENFSEGQVGRVGGA